MSNVMYYKGCRGSAEVSIDDKVLYGKILGIDDLYSYEAPTIRQLEDAFRSTVDEFLVGHKK